jgi:hypothetical protein
MQILQIKSWLQIKSYVRIFTHEIYDSLILDERFYWENIFIFITFVIVTKITKNNNNNNKKKIISARWDWMGYNDSIKHISFY